MKVFMLLALVISTQAFAKPVEPDQVQLILGAIDTAIAEKELNCLYSEAENPEVQTQMKGSDLRFSDSYDAKIDMNESVPSLVITSSPLPGSGMDNVEHVATVVLSADATQVKTINLIGRKKIVSYVNRGTITRPDIQEVVKYTNTYTLDCK